MTNPAVRRTEQQLAALFAAPGKRGVVKIEGAKVSYALPTER